LGKLVKHSFFERRLFLKNEKDGKENTDLDFKLELPEPKNVAQLVTTFYNLRSGNFPDNLSGSNWKETGTEDCNAD